MKVTLSSTSKIVELNGVPARIWEGQTESGIPVHCYITRISHHKDYDDRAEEFRRDLEEHATPSPAVNAIPLRLIL